MKKIEFNHTTEELENIIEESKYAFVVSSFFEHEYEFGTFNSVLVISEPGKYWRVSCDGDKMSMNNKYSSLPINETKNESLLKDNWSLHLKDCGFYSFDDINELFTYFRESLHPNAESLTRGVLIMEYDSMKGEKWNELLSMHATHNLHRQLQEELPTKTKKSQAKI